ncbi:MAG TPA: mechanosensitive ion channel domain-containing protein [Coriobacteriia bacterium]|jgi:small-conductance mechanosensitive channel
MPLDDTTAIAALAADVGFLQRMGRSAFGILESLADKLPYIVMALVFLLLAWWASLLTMRLVRAALARTSTEGHVDVLVAKTTGAVVFGIGAIVALSIMGVQVGVLVTSLGLAGVTIGFALKDVLANSMAGILLLLQRPFTIGDSINVAGCEGVVRDIRVRDTLVEQADGRMVFVPNATVFNAPITNTSAATRRRLEVRVRIPLTADFEAAREAALLGLGRVNGLAEDAPLEAVYVATHITSVTLAARAWVDTAQTPFARALDGAVVAVAGALRDAGVEPAAAE